MNSKVVLLCSAIIFTITFYASSDQFLKKKDANIKGPSLSKMKDALCAESMVPVSVVIPDLVAHMVILQKDLLLLIQQHVADGQWSYITTKEQVVTIQQQLDVLKNEIEKLTVNIKNVHQNIVQHK